MTFTEDNLAGPVTTKDVSWSHVESYIRGMHPQQRAFCSLVDHNSGSYIQCAGGSGWYVVEQREYTGTDFRHYVLGPSKSISPLQAVWTTISGRMGDVRVHDTEALRTDVVLLLFRAFYDGRPLPEGYQKRNVTRLYK